MLAEQSDIPCLVDQGTIEQCALTYASDVSSKVRLLTLVVPSLGNQNELAHIIDRAAVDLGRLQRLLTSS